MRRRTSMVLSSALALIVVAALIGAGTVAAAPPKDKTAPSAPTNLHVTATTANSVSLAWTASKDNVAVTSYKACCANVSSQSVAAPATTMDYTAGIEPGRSVTLVLYAIDAAGNYSKPSNSVTVTTPRDTTAPSKPTVTVTSVGPTHVSLAWSSVDDGPNLRYSVTRDGLTLLAGSRDTTGTFGPLAPETTYTFVVTARDFGGNVSSPSDPVVVTTPPRDPTDTTPPTKPGNLRTTFSGPDGETWLAWNASTDDRTPQPIIEYRIFVNGVLDNWGLGGTSDIVYGNPQAMNTYSVVAVDESGNASAPATLVVDNH